MIAEKPEPVDPAHKVASHGNAVRLGRIIMPMYWRGATLQKIADSLNEAGIMTVRGKAWHPAQVRRMIRRLTE